LLIFINWFFILKILSSAFKERLHENKINPVNRSLPHSPHFICHSIQAGKGNVLINAMSSVSFLINFLFKKRSPAKAGLS